MKNYIIVTPFFPKPNCFRGAYIYDQVQAIRKLNKFNVYVFVPVALLSSLRIYEYEGIKVFCFPSIFMPSYILNGFTNFLNVRLFLHRLKQVKIDIDEISIIHCHTSIFGDFGLYVKKINNRIKVLLQHHDRDPFTIRNGRFADNKLNLFFKVWRNICLFKQIDIHVSISKVVEDNLISFPSPGKYETYEPYLNILKANPYKVTPHINKSVILYNGVDISKFYPLDSPRNIRIFTIGCIGNFVELKDQITLIKAVELLINSGVEDIQVRFVGSGPTLANCMKYINDRNLDRYFIFESEVHHHELVSFYNKLDLFVLPSVYEGFGCVFTEAYASGVPFMACENQGGSEYICIEDKAKWIFPIHDFRILSSLIKQYKEKRYPQKLKYDFDIDILIRDFINNID